MQIDLRRIQGFKLWKRRTFHECATELEQVSRAFRVAHLGEGHASEAERQRTLDRTSIKGVEILRILALAIRSEQDYGTVPLESKPVGVALSDLSDDECDAIVEDYEGPHTKLGSGANLSIRDALNKIAHADGSKGGYFANLEEHDLLLCGTLRKKTWLAVVSIPTLCREIKALPDVPIRS